LEVKLGVLVFDFLSHFEHPVDQRNHKGNYFKSLTLTDNKNTTYRICKMQTKQSLEENIFINTYYERKKSLNFSKLFPGSIHQKKEGDYKIWLFDKIDLKIEKLGTKHSSLSL
jgi:hypothetical protein